VSAVVRSIIPAGALLGAALALAPAANAGSLPRVHSGEPPGPPLLYERAPNAPELSVKRPFRAPPLLVSGTDAYSRGEYVYQDYLYDDHGASTRPGSSSPPGSAVFSPTDGDVFYPTAAAFANNAADLVELRIRPTRRAIVYRVTLNTVVDEDTAAVAIGIDTDRSGGAPAPWPRGAGISSPGVDRFIVAWGTGGEVTSPSGGGTTPLPNGAVRIDERSNQLTIKVKRTLMDPGAATWRYVAGVGLWSGSGFLPVPAATEPTAGSPASGNAAQDAPAIFNLAFRFDEPQSRGGGVWFEQAQSQALAERTSGGFFADVDFARLRSGRDGPVHPPGLEQARIYASSISPHEGVREDFPEFGGRLQPYLLVLPEGYRPGHRAGLTFALHSLSGSHTQYVAFSPRQPLQLGSERDSLYVTTLGRGPDGWYTDEAEVDFFEVWADVARRFTLDPDRVALSGYSMGGYGTYKLGLQWPDLFGRAFTTVGPPGRGIWVPPDPPVPGGQASNSNLLVENARWVPYLNWVGETDVLVPIAGTRAQQARFDELRLRSQLWAFPFGHLNLAVLDRWEPARDLLGPAEVERDPSRVDYAFVPDADRPALGLVHDHAYWVSDLRVRDRSGDPFRDPARGEISARSLAFGEGDPITRRVSLAHPGPPERATVEGTEWTEIPSRPKLNALELRLENVGSAEIDGRRAHLSGRRCLRIAIDSDGPARVRLSLRLKRRARAVVGGSCQGERRATGVELGRRGADFEVSAGLSTYVIRSSGDD
jgi:hypothetical protein